MKGFLLLLKVRTKESFEGNKVLMFPLYLAALGLFYGLGYLLAASGLRDVLPLIGYIAATAVTFIVTIITLTDTFAGREDSEYLLSTPISSFSQVLVQFLSMYLRNLLWCILIEVPFYVIYRQYGTGTGSVAAWIVGLLFTSLPVNGIAVLVGMVLVLCLVTSPYKDRILSILSLILMCAVIVLAAWIGDRIYLVLSGQIPSDADTIAQVLCKEITGSFRLGRFYQRGVIEGDGGSFMLYLFMSIIWYGVFLFLHSVSYQIVVTSLRCPVVYGALAEDKLCRRVQKPSMAIFKKELHQLVNTRRYFLKVALGMILGIAIPVNFIIIKPLTLPMAHIIIPALGCLIMGLCATTYCSISMEGRRHWILGASPVEGKASLYGKCFANLILTLPVAVIGGVLYGIAFHAGPVTAIYILIPVLYDCMLALWGLYLDYKFHRYDKGSAELILHHGVPFLLGYLPGIILPIVVLAACVLRTQL